MSEDNIKLWKSVEDTDSNYMKDVSFGSFKYKSVDAQYQLLKATTLWGSFGDKWGVKNEVFTPIMTGDNSVASIIYTAILYYPSGEFCINSDIRLNSKTKNGYIENKDYAKKVSTDALTKGLSKLGFSADIFMGKFDGNKYDGIESFEPKEDVVITPEELKLLNKCIDVLNTNGMPDKATALKSKFNNETMHSVFEVLYKTACNYVGEEIKL